MKKLLIFTTILAATLTMSAQQPSRVTRTWFPNPDVKIETPAFTSGSYYTSYKTMMEYIKSEVKANQDIMKMEIVGQTGRHRDIPLITISNGKNSDSKLRVLYTGCIHGNEHAGTEGLMWFVHQLGQDADTRRLLDNIDFYIMPMVNIDGSESDERYVANGTDPNRDQTRLSTVEMQCLHKVATMVMPHMYIDFHEFKPLRTAYGDITDKLISNPNDFMFLYSSNPNVYPELPKFVEDKLIPNAQEMAKKWGLRSSIYFTTKSEGDHTVMNIGGQSARSSSNIMALRGCVSMLMEIRGVGLRGTSYLRRVNTVYQLAQSYANTAVSNKALLQKIVADGYKQDRPIVTEYKVPTDKNHPFEFIDLLKNELVTIPVDARPAKQLKVKKSVARPKAYYISAKETLALDLIKKFGIKYETLSEAQSLSLETYRVVSMRMQRAEVLNMHPVSVNVETEQKTVNLPAGSIRIPMDQPLSTLAGILLEPECANGFVNFHVVEPLNGAILHIYREN